MNIYKEFLSFKIARSWSWNLRGFEFISSYPGSLLCIMAIPELLALNSALERYINAIATGHQTMDGHVVVSETPGDTSLPATARTISAPPPPLRLAYPYGRASASSSSAQGPQESLAYGYAEDPNVARVIRNTTDFTAESTSLVAGIASIAAKLDSLLQAVNALTLKVAELDRSFSIMIVQNSNVADLAGRANLINQSLLLPQPTDQGSSGLQQQEGPTPVAMPAAINALSDLTERLRRFRNAEGEAASFAADCKALLRQVGEEKIASCITASTVACGGSRARLISRLQSICSRS